MQSSLAPALLILSFLCSPLLAAVDFAAAPKVERAGDHAIIAFTLKEAADVEVAVLDAQGKVVRHLAAGVLGGKNAPPGPLAPGLAQKVAWDGRDDLGKPVTTWAGGPAENHKDFRGPFSVRVRAGMSVSFGRYIGGSPYTGSVTSMPYRTPVNGLVVDDKGNLYVKMMSAIGSHGNSGKWPWHIRLFDNKGEYVRTLLPYPANTPVEKATGYTLIGASEPKSDDPLRAASAGLVPANSTSLYPVFANFGNEILHRLHDGRMVFVHSEKRQLSFLSLDGSNKVSTVTMWPASAKLKCPDWLDIQVALSPDGKYAYYSNVAAIAYDGKQPSDIDANWPQGRVYRHDLSKADAPGAVPEPFFDLPLPDFEKEKYWMPSAWDKKSAAQGIDTDAKGNLILCDLVNHQVVEISPEGKQLSAFKVNWPDRVIASRTPGSDALYVFSRKVSRGSLPPATLVKITGRGEKAVVAAELQLEGTVGGAATLDESGEVPVLWLAGEAKEQGAPHKLIRIEDRGDKLAVSNNPHGTGLQPVTNDNKRHDGTTPSGAITAARNYINRDDSAISFVSYMDVDREADFVYITNGAGGERGRVWRFHGPTGDGGPTPLRAVDLAIGPAGDVYTWGNTGSYSGPIARYARDLKPKPLGNTDDKNAHLYGHLYGRAGRGSSVCGMDVDALGRVIATFGSNDCHVRLYDAQGQLVQFPRTVDSREGEKPDTKGRIPAAITGVVGYGGSIRFDPAGNIYLLQQGVPNDFALEPGFEKDEAYRSALGTIYKFPPTGGEIISKNGTVQSVTGHVAAFAGCGPVSRWAAVGSCACTKPRFDVDDFGRVYIPNAITYTVSVRDNADNEIARFGGYGNYDDAGKDRAIPLGWPVTAGASDKHIYVGDCLNHRVVRVDKKWAVETVVAVK